jgi:hypothetical protein
VKLQDIHGNTAFHYLCQNSTSQEDELITIFQYLKMYNIVLEKKNEDDETAIDLLIKRIKDKNPYDGNLQSVRLLYCNILDSVSPDFYDSLSSNLNFIPKEKILRSNMNNSFTLSSSNLRDSSLKRRGSLKKQRSFV